MHKATNYLLISSTGSGRPADQPFSNLNNAMLMQFNEARPYFPKNNLNVNPSAINIQTPSPLKTLGFNSRW